MSILGEYLQRVKAERDEMLALLRRVVATDDLTGWCGKQASDLYDDISLVLSRYDLPDDYDEA
jgi:hypothetical protein